MTVIIILLAVTFLVLFIQAVIINHLEHQLIDSGIIEIDRHFEGEEVIVNRVAKANDLVMHRQELESAVKEIKEICENSSECLAAEIGQIREKQAKLAQYLNVAFIPATIEAKASYYEPKKATKQTKKN
ncbi:MAG: hypothetical protein HF309_18135 [Ignavibacteria bacterium]|jgi:hypothetical protein|nr:hypothetical protein [Ignavibacteria bacterium]MCU7518540.1 hypothetical protein [Ignavibacteria bacterium]